MHQPQRNISSTLSNDYRYSFQGQEKDDEIKGEGNSINYTYRMHDPRVGRFFAVDPLAGSFPWNSVYAFSENRVVDCIELEGLEIYYAADGTYLGQVGTSNHVYVTNDDISNEQATEYIQKMNNGDYSQEDWNTITANNTRDTGMDIGEIRARAFLTTIRQAENGNKPDGDPLDYNVNYGGGTFDDYSKHPNKPVTKWGSTSTAAGAYQILFSTWSRVSNQIDLEDFTPISQDKAAVQIIKNVEQWNPDKAEGVMLDIVSGKTLSAVKKLNKTWTSLPGGGEEQMTDEEFITRYNENFVNELNGTSVIATPQGELDVDIPGSASKGGNGLSTCGQ